MLGGLVRGDVTVQTATREATQGEVARRGFECTSDAAQTRGTKYLPCERKDKGMHIGPVPYF